jgi:hypothetical protein
MASIRKQGDLCEIRECLATERGPRQHALVTFRGVLTPDVLDRAEARATRPFYRRAVARRARRLGIAVGDRHRYPAARALLASLQRGERLEPTLVELLRSALDRLEARPVPEHLADAAEWIGQGERERGAALRGLVRTADRILASRPALRTRAAERFPKFSSEPAGQRV